jgi:Leucine-rich repeat (LRR) protein
MLHHQGQLRGYPMILKKSSPFYPTFLPELKNLIHLVLDDCQLTDISLLAGLTQLTTLDLSENIQSEGIEVLSNLENLLDLNLLWYKSFLFFPIDSIDQTIFPWYRRIG